MPDYEGITQPPQPPLTGVELMEIQKTLNKMTVKILEDLTGRPIDPNTISPTNNGFSEEILLESERRLLEQLRIPLGRGVLGYCEYYANYLVQHAEASPRGVLMMGLQLGAAIRGSFIDIPKLSTRDSSQ